MSKIEVVNIKKVGKPTKPWEVYIGRKNVSYGVEQSPLHNPYPEAKYGRARCIELFKWDLRAVLEGVPNVNRRSDEDMIDMYSEFMFLKEILEKEGKLTLVCWCAPMACHGDVIKTTLEKC